MIAYICRMLSGTMLFIMLMISSASAEKQAPGLAGHYYLTGVREVGSELVLHADGHYEWMLAYGALDFVSRGNWSLQNGRVVLQAEIAPQSGQLFSLPKNGISFWNANMEQRLQDEFYSQGRSHVLEICPFLGIPDYASAAYYTEEKHPSAELEKRASVALEELEKAVAGLEQAARDAMAARRVKAGADSEAAMQRAIVAMERYQGAWAAVKDTHWAAGRNLPPRPFAKMPAECVMPVPPVVSDKPESWQGGIAVLVGDAEAGLRFSAVRVRLVYSDGHTVEKVTGRSGVVVAQYRQSGLQKIELSLADGGRPAEVLVVPPQHSRGAVYHVQLDSRAVVKPFFTRMELEVENGRLLSGTLGGSYGKH